MSELACLPKRQPVYITIPPLLCEVPECTGVRICDMVTLFLADALLEIIQVCGFHKWAWEGRTPTNFFPLNGSPPMEWMIHQVNEHLAAERAKQYARQPQQTQYYNVFYGNMTGSTTTFFRFG